MSLIGSGRGVGGEGDEGEREVEKGWAGERDEETGILLGSKIERQRHR